MTYKVIYWRPILQAGGIYDFAQDEYWISNTHLRGLKKILECTSRDSGMDHWDYDLFFEVPPGTPQHGHWGYKFVLYPVSNGTPETEYKGWIVGNDNQDLSAAYEIEQLLAAWQDEAVGQTHFTY